MSAAEFRITTDLAPLRQFQIEANFEETKAWLTENLEPLRTMAVTAESMSQCKQYRASIRKVSARIDESRKMAKAAALEAYSGFETKCRELTALCEEAAGALDVQIKAMEEAAKQEKKDRLAAYFAQVVGDMAEWLTFDDCFNPKWLNATYTESTAQMDICAAIDRCRADLNAIRALHSEFETTLLDEYTRTRNISAVLVKNETLGRMKAAEEERKRKEAEAAAKYAASLEETKRVADDTMRQAEQKSSETGRSVVEALGELSKPVNDLVDEDGHEMPAVQEPEYKVDFRVFGTARQLDGLKAYMQKNGIRFMPVPQE
nr:MAG TPA: Protein of unknown function (DUF1351) [Caudoviricetes sp.]